MAMELDDGSGLMIAWEPPVFVGFFYGPPTVERLDFLFEQEKQWTEKFPRFSAISLIDPRVGKEMKADARNRAKEIAGYFDAKMVASVTIVEGGGFFAAMVRSIIAGMQLFSRKSTLHVAATVEDGVEIVRATGVPAGLEVNVAATIEVLNRMRAKKKP